MAQTVKQALEKAQTRQQATAEETKSVKTGTKKTPVETSLLTSQTDKVLDIPMSELLDLKSSTFPNAAKAQRKIDSQNLDSLMSVTDDAQIPPILVQRVKHGDQQYWLIVGGYHRQLRKLGLTKRKYYQTLAKKHGIDYVEMDDEELGEAVKKWENKEQLMAILDKTTIKAQPFNAASPFSLIAKAIMDNSQHGKPADLAQRTQLAAWMLEDAKERGVKLTVRKAAAMCLVSHTAVNKFLKRDLRVTEKLAEGKITEEEAKKQLASNEEDKQAKRVSTLFRLMVEVYKDMETFTEEECLDYLESNVDSKKLDETSDMLDLFAKLQDRVTDMQVEIEEEIGEEEEEEE